MLSISFSKPAATPQPEAGQRRRALGSGGLATATVIGSPHTITIPPGRLDAGTLGPDPNRVAGTHGVFGGLQLAPPSRRLALLPLDSPPSFGRLTSSHAPVGA